MSDIIEILPFVLVLALVFFKRGAKVSKNMSEPKVEDEYIPEVSFRREKAKPRVKIEKPRVSYLKPIENLNDKAEDKIQEVTESILPEEINWQHAVVYAEILKPKFDE